MRIHVLAAVAALAAGATQAQPINERPPTWTIQCIEVSGATVPPRCNVPGSRLDQSEFICTCPAGGMRTRVPICAAGQNPPAENLALNRVRREASRDGTLEGDRVRDRPICVAPRRP